MLDKLVYTEKKATRNGFGAGLLEVGKKNKKVIALCADLIGSLKMQPFIDKYPSRFYQVGIAEANMMGIAAGLALSGYIPYTCLLYTSPSPRDRTRSRMPSSA